MDEQADGRIDYRCGSVWLNDGPMDEGTNVPNDS